jgi:hypothetical protein
VTGTRRWQLVGLPPRIALNSARGFKRLTPLRDNRIDSWARSPGEFARSRAMELSKRGPTGSLG